MQALLALTCDSIEKGLCPSTILKCIGLRCWGYSPQTLANFCVQKFDKKLYFVLAGSLRTKGKLPITFGCAIIRMHNSKGSLCFLYKI